PHIYSLSLHDALPIFNLNILLDSRWGGSIYSATNAYGTDFGLEQRTVANNVRETGVAVSGVDENGDPYSANIPAQTYFRGIAYRDRKSTRLNSSHVKM